MSDHTPLVVDGDTPPTTRDRAWVEHAACIGHNPDDFVFDTKHGARTKRKVARAVAICSTCPVKQQCLASELDHMRAGGTSVGIFGGTTIREREQLLNAENNDRLTKRARTLRTPMVHGTAGGRMKHHRYPELYGPVCDACRQAHNARQAERQRRWRDAG